MEARFNPSGTQIRDGVLKVRIDVIPQFGDKTSVLHYVDHFDRPPTDEELADPYLLSLIPTHKRMNPCLCHSMSVPENVSDLRGYIHQTFDYATVATLDNVLPLPNSAHYVSPLMQGKRFPSVKVKTTDKSDLIASINKKFSGLSMQLVYGNAFEIEPMSIDVGEPATDRSTILDIADVNVISMGNPANATGSIDTVKVWAWVTDHIDFWVGTYFLVSGTTYECRDSVDIGALTAGSEQTLSGLDMSIETDDFIGAKHRTAGNYYLEEDNSGGGGHRTFVGEAIDPGDQASFALSAGDVVSLNGTGSEPSVGGRGWAQK